jgi:CubicO group peptidase (beta-lactamase class C family)
MKKKTLIFMLIAICPLIIKTGESEILRKKMEELMTVYSQKDLFSGAVVVAREGKIIYAGAVGEANKDHQVANTLNTRFNIGSIGKTFTATAIMQLVQEGKLKLNDSIGQYLPDCPFSEKKKITIHHLLNHTSGMVVAGAIIEKVSGMSYGQYLNEQIFIPLGNEKQRNHLP